VQNGTVTPTGTARPTLHDVAEHANVSKSLVSLALRGDPGVGEQTRLRILRSADELGYRSNALARSLREGRTMLIGAVLSSLDNPYHVEIVAGLEQAAEQAGLGVIMVHGSKDLDRRARHLDALLDLGVDGVVMIGSRTPAGQLQRAARRTPIVMVGRSESPIAGIDSVRNDDERGAALAVDHLVGLGRTGIAHVTSGDRPAGRARRRGYEAAMRERGLSGIRIIERESTPDLPAALAAAHADGVDAVFARNDVEAFDVLDAAVDAGLSVPGDLAVVGYDDTVLARRARPTLTSIVQPRQQMGALAVELLRERQGGRTDDRDEVLSPSIAVRASTAGWRR